LGIAEYFEASDLLKSLLESNAHEFIASAPGWSYKKQNVSKFQKEMASFFASNQGVQKFALVAVKMLSVVLEKPVALAIVFPGIPFHENCGPFLISGQSVLDKVKPGTDPLVLMYQPVGREWTVFERNTTPGKRKRVTSSRERLYKRIKHNHRIGIAGHRTEATLKKYKISPNFFAFKASFQQLLL
jgi:hypothetical protein